MRLQGNSMAAISYLRSTQVSIVRSTKETSNINRRLPCEYLEQTLYDVTFNTGYT